MAVTSVPIFPQGPNLGVGTVTNGSGTTPQTIFTAGANGSKVESVAVSSTDTSARDVALYLTRSATNYLLGTVSIPANSGNTNALPAVDLLRSSMLPAFAYDAFGNRALYLKSGDTLTLGALVAVTSGKTITAVVGGADF